MSKVIVSLISDQTIPNILFLKEMKGDKYILVSTTQMEKALNAILSIAEIDEEKIEILEVKAWDLNDIAERFSTKITDNEAHYVINITGGTKIMSLGTYQFFSTLNSDFYYLPIGKNAYQKINPSPREIQKFTYKLKVLDYLKCYGLTVESSSNELYSDALTYRFFDLFVDGGLSNQDYSTIGKLRSKLTDSNISAKMNKDLHHLINKMNNSLPKAEQLEIISHLNEREIRYLTGGWFEEYIYLKIKQELQLSNDHIKINVKITHGTAAPNEWDIMFVHKNQLYAIECKTGLKDTKALNELFYKLKAQKGEMGLTATCYFFSLSNYRIPHSKEFNPIVRDRAEQNKVNIIDRSLILDEEKLTQIIKKI